MIPLKIELNFSTRPYSNYLIILITVIVTIMAWGNSESTLFNMMVHKNWNPVGIFGSLFLHGDLFHLFFNMLFLFVFGNAICSELGNKFYPLIYLFLGFASGVIHLLLDGRPAIGASGAIAGMIGLVTVLYPLSKIRIYSFYFTFRLYALIVGLIYLLMDILGVYGADDGIAHFAHLGGFLTGAVAGIILLSMNFIDFAQRSLIDVILGRKKSYKMSFKEKMRLGKFEQKDYKEYSRSLMNKYETEHLRDVNDNFGPLEYPRESIPLFRVLKTLETEAEIKCFIVNDGDTILNINFPDKNKFCKIEPVDSLSKGGSGVITFSKETFKQGKVEFCIEYNNPDHFNSRKNFAYSLKEKTIKMEDSENVEK